MRNLFSPRGSLKGRASALFLAPAFASIVFLLAVGTPERLASQSATPQQQTHAKSDQPGGPPPGATYVGAETCKGCHEEIYNKHFAGTAHYALMKESGKHGCEDCHGPGSAHVEGGGDASKIIRFENLSQNESSKICLNCHAASAEHGNFLRSRHATGDVGCTSCHSPHNAKTDRGLLRQSQPQLCYGCHTDIKAEFNRPFRHRVNEGLIQCDDCHNPHGTLQTKQLRSAAGMNQVCMKCHMETRGPFAFEHLPVKTEGCVSCHMPHGSPNQRLLRVSQVNTLCLQCHTLSFGDTPSQPPVGPAHNQTVKYQACTMCHVYIHGSNYSEVYFKP